MAMNDDVPPGTWRWLGGAAVIILIFAIGGIGLHRHDELAVLPRDGVDGQIRNAPVAGYLNAERRLFNAPAS